MHGLADGSIWSVDHQFSRAYLLGYTIDFHMTFAGSIRSGLVLRIVGIHPDFRQSSIPIDRLCIETCNCTGSRGSYREPPAVVSI